MQQDTVQVSVSFEALATAVSNLSLVDKIRLWTLLEAELDTDEENDPDVRAEIQRALDEYASGDVLTLDEYLAQQKDK